MSKRILITMTGMLAAAALQFSCGSSSSQQMTDPESDSTSRVSQSSESESEASSSEASQRELSSESPDSVEPISETSNSSESVSHPASLNFDMPCSGEVLLVEFTHEYSVLTLDHDFTVDDFEEVDPVDVMDGAEKSLAEMRKAAAGEPYDDSEWQFETFKRAIFIVFGFASYENLQRAADILICQERVNWVYLVYQGAK